LSSYKKIIFTNHIFKSIKIPDFVKRDRQFNIPYYGMVMESSITYKIEGMTCDACARRIEKVVGKLDETDVKVSFATESIYFSEQPKNFTLVKETIDKLGYKLLEEDSLPQKSSSDFWGLGVGIVCTSLLMLPMILMLFKIHFHYPVFLEILLSSITLAFPGYKFFKSAFLTLKSYSANMDVLVSVGSGSAFLLSLYNALTGNLNQLYFESTASILTFVGIGKLLEKKAKRNTGLILQELLESLPKFIKIPTEQGFKEVPISKIQSGDKIVVYASDTIPLDGIVVYGISSVEESSLTGEPLPITKKKNDSVFAGSINLDGTLIISVNGDVHSTRIHRIYKSLEDSISSKPKIQRLADVVSNYFIMSVFIISFLTFIIWLFLTGDFTKSMLPAISVLVISCPCALGLATPTAILVGNGVGAKLGILFKNSSIMEDLASIQVLLFDKTGTLTEGKPEIKKIDYLGDLDKEKVNQILYLATKDSKHPVSMSIHNSFKNQLGNLNPTQKHKTFPGKGVSIEWEGNTYYLGSSIFAQEFSIFGFQEESNENTSTISYLFTKEQLLARIELEDTIRDKTKILLQRLKEMKLTIGILSGDNENSVKKFASLAPIDFYLSQLKPEDKLKEIQKLQGQGKKVGMVGDGINDSNALAGANVGIGLSTGTDISKEVSDITIMKDDILLIAESIRLAKATISKIRQNLLLAFIYNIACIPLAAMGVLNPMIAGAAMGLSSVSVVTNSLLLKKFQILEEKNHG
jgi:Cu+-exporting ATPase